MWKWECEADHPKGAVVIVHGSGEHHGRYMWLKDKWCEEGFHVVMGDLPGQGQSTRRRGHIDSFNDYIETVSSWVSEALHYELPVFLFGHSLGGLVVIRTATEKELPLAGLILSSPCTGLANQPPKAFKAVGKVLNKLVPTVRFPIKLSTKNVLATRNEEVIKRDEEDPLIVKKVSARWYNELIQAMKLSFEKIGEFPDLPLLVLQGGDDQIVNKHSVRKWFNSLTLTDRTYKEWQGFYHEVFNEPERDDVFRYATGFVKLHL